MFYVYFTFLVLLLCINQQLLCRYQFCIVSSANCSRLSKIFIIPKFVLLFRTLCCSIKPRWSEILDLNLLQNLLEVAEVQLGDVAGAEVLAEVGQAAGATARSVVHAVGEAAEGLAGPGSADHQVRHLSHRRLRHRAQLVQTTVWQQWGKYHITLVVTSLN